MSTLSRILFVCVHPRSPDTVACSAILLTFQVSFGAMYLHMSVDSQPILIQHRILYYIFVCIALKWDTSATFHNWTLSDSRRSKQTNRVKTTTLGQHDFLDRERASGKAVGFYT